MKPPSQPSVQPAESLPSLRIAATEDHAPSKTPPFHPHVHDRADVVIRVEHLSKEYRLGTINHGTFQKDLQSYWARLWGKEDPNSLLTWSAAQPRPGEVSPDGRFLALDDVSFDIARGESVGIIGNNGAGKSTLLKILSRIVTPDRGRVRMRGRTSSLLEVGTGFHQELSGRDNVFMNGYRFWKSFWMVSMWLMAIWLA